MSPPSEIKRRHGLRRFSTSSQCRLETKGLHALGLRLNHDDSTTTLTPSWHDRHTKTDPLTRTQSPRWLAHAKAGSYDIELSIQLGLLYLR